MRDPAAHRTAAPHVPPLDRHALTHRLICFPPTRDHANYPREIRKLTTSYKLTNKQIQNNALQPSIFKYYDMGLSPPCITRGAWDHPLCGESAAVSSEVPRSRYAAYGLAPTL